MELKFKKLSPKAVIPKYAKPGDAGMDLVTIDQGQYSSKSYLPVCITYKTGLAVEIPPGCVGLLFPRSSIANTSLSLANSVGVIDSGYRGEIIIKFRTQEPEFSYKAGERIAQLVVVPFVACNPVEAIELSDTERGDGGFGSTGVA